MNTEMDLQAAVATERKIIHVPRRFTQREWGGTETVILELSRQQRMAGWNPEIVTSRALDPQANDEIDGVPIHRFGYTYPYLGLSEEERHALDKKGGNLISAGLLLHLMRSPNVRLFHSHALKRLGGKVRTAARWRHKPYVVTLHGGFFDVPTAEQTDLTRPTEGKFEWGKAVGALLGSREVLEDADHVICVGNGEFQKAREQLGHDRISLLPNGVDCGRFAEADGGAFRRRHNIPQSAYLILCLSRIDAQKNQATLLEAFATISRLQPHAHLVLAGPATQPAYADKLRERIRELRLDKRVLLLPGIPNHSVELVQAYHACDVFVLPSRHEPFGIVALEAWSAGKPVIASHVGGLGRLVTHQETGLLFDPAAKDASVRLAAHLQHLCLSPEVGHKLGEAGRDLARSTYSWESVNRQQEGIYQQAEAWNRARHLRRAA